MATTNAPDVSINLLRTQQKGRRHEEETRTARSKNVFK